MRVFAIGRLRTPRSKADDSECRKRGTSQLRRQGRRRSRIWAGSQSERDDVRNVGEGTNRTLAHKAPKASLGEMLRPKPALCHEAIAGLLQYSMFQPAVPFAS